MRATYYLAAAFLFAGFPGAASAAIEATMYKNPSCTCCETYAAYLEKNGFKVTLIPSNDVDQVAAREGVPASLRGCHTITVGNFVIEGFVPIEHIRKFASSPQTATGLAMPGMPMDIPGMGFDSMPGMAKSNMIYTTYAFNRNGSEPVVFGTYPET